MLVGQRTGVNVVGRGQGSEGILHFLVHMPRHPESWNEKRTEVTGGSHTNAEDRTGFMYFEFLVRLAWGQRAPKRNRTWDVEGS